MTTSARLSVTLIMAAILNCLGILLISLKAASIIDWPWWVVTSPLWIPATTYGLIIILAVVVTVVLEAMDKESDDRPTT